MARSINKGWREPDPDAPLTIPLSLKQEAERPLRRLMKALKPEVEAAIEKAASRPVPTYAVKTADGRVVHEENLN